MLLKAHKHIPYLGNASKLRHCIPHGVIFQGQQVGQLLLVQLADALGNVVIQYKGEELLLVVGVAFEDAPFAALDSLQSVQDLHFDAL